MALPASVARTRVAEIIEVTNGTTPTTPVFQNLRVTGAGLRSNKGTAPIRELRSDANVIAEVQTAQWATGAYNFALSYGSFDDIFSSALRNTWSTNVLKNGTSIISMTFEETLDHNGSSTYARVPYALVDTLSLQIDAEKEVTGSFGLIGQKLVVDTAIASGATYTATNTKMPMAAGLSVAALSVLGLSTPKVKGLKLDIKNGIRRRHVVDSLYPDSFGYDLMDVTGSVDIYFDSNAALTQVLNHGTGSIAATIGQTTNEKYTISLPVVQFLDGVRQLGGTNADVLMSIPFRATGSDNSSNPSISITRAVA